MFSRDGLTKQSPTRTTNVFSARSGSLDAQPDSSHDQHRDAVSGPAYGLETVSLSAPFSASSSAAPPHGFFLQRKLRIGGAADPLEREADRAADQVIGGERAPKEISSAGHLLQRKWAECKQEEEDEDKPVKLSRKASSGSSIAGDVAPPIVNEVLRSAGRALDQATSARFQSAFGHDFSTVRLHVDDRAAASAASVSARAYTVGTHVVFGRGEYTPTSAAGLRLLGHELAHVVQQSRSSASSSAAETATTEASADTAAHAAVSGRAVSVAGSSPVGMARQELFTKFSGGKYSWPILKGVLTPWPQLGSAAPSQRPVATIVADVEALPSADRDQAIHDIIAERKLQADKLADLKEKQSQQTDPALRTVMGPTIKNVSDFITRADQVLDGLLGDIAIGGITASLKASATAPTEAQKPQIESALKPDVSLTTTGAQQAFNPQCTPAVDPKKDCYKEELLTATQALIKRGVAKKVDKKGPEEHKDKTKTHTLKEAVRVGNASKDETDKVFGQYRKGPALTTGTGTAPGNIYDQWAATQSQLSFMKDDAKRDMARQFVMYLFQSQNDILTINKAHNADPKFVGKDAPNDEAKDQVLVADEITKDKDKVKDLNEIERGWGGKEDAGKIYVQLFKEPDVTTGPEAGQNLPDRKFLWKLFQTLIHEYLHTLAHPQYSAYAEGKYGGDSSQWNTLIEGVDSLLDEIVWNNVLPRAKDQPLRDAVEGPDYSNLPAMADDPEPPGRYPSYAQALKLVEVVGIRNLYAAYFLGDVNKIGAEEPSKTRGSKP